MPRRRPVGAARTAALQYNRLERTARIVNESTASRGLYRIEDEDEMRRAFQKNLTQDRSKWLYSYGPLEVSLQDP